MTVLEMICCFLLCLFVNVASLMFVAELRVRTKKRRKKEE